MRSWLSVVCTAVVLTALSTPAAAQWPPHPTPDVPRLPDGEPDLTGPVPRTADGRPDLTGIWQRPAPQRDEDGEIIPPEPSDVPRAAFWTLGENMEGGLPYRPWAAALREQRMADDMKDNPDAHCLPMGHMQFHSHPQPRKIIQTPDVMLILYEGNAGLRQIFTDGRASPDNDPVPWWYGYSVGHWEGDTLVVTTTHLRDGGWLDVEGSPLTDQAKIIERFTRPDFGHMQIDVTIDDPKAYTEPFTVRVEHEIMLDTELIEFVCNENEKSTQHFDP